MLLVAIGCGVCISWTLPPPPPHPTPYVLIPEKQSLVLD